MRFHQLGHDFGLFCQRLFGGRDPVLLGVVDPPIADRPLEGDHGRLQLCGEKLK